MDEVIAAKDASFGAGDVPIAAEDVVIAAKDVAIAAEDVEMAFASTSTSEPALASISVTSHDVPAFLVNLFSLLLFSQLFPSFATSAI